jgi:hypothetical protein
LGCLGAGAGAERCAARRRVVRCDRPTIFYAVTDQAGVIHASERSDGRL